MDINYELYKVFFYVAQSLSFSEASKHLYISQSAVSQSIKTMERKLGQPLFIRSTKKVQLTPAGQLLLKHIEPAMNLIRRGENQLFPEISSAVSECTDQSYKCYFSELCGSAGTGKSGSDHYKCSKYSVESVLHPKNSL